MTKSTEFAWRVHSAQEQWTAKSDTKASIVLTLFTFVFATGLAAWTGQVDSFEAIQGDLDWKQSMAAVGLVLLLVGLACAAISIYPKLGKRQVESGGLIYFGHIRKRSPRDVESELSNLTRQVELENLANQLVEMSKANWFKHRCLQASIWFGGVGGVVFAVAAFVP